VRIALILLVSFVGLMMIASAIAYLALAVPAMRRAKPLSEQDQEHCRRVIREGSAYPFLCAQAVKNGKCPCQPCAKLEQAKAAVALPARGS